MLAAVKTASLRDGLRPVLTAAVRGAVPILRPGRRNGGSTELRNLAWLEWARTIFGLCGRPREVRIKRCLSLQKHTREGKQSVRDAAESAAVRMATGA